ncbi:hypothetical protein FDB23_01035 [Clostridium botulinum]|nr:hypothetical protein [Clostridium botulinum]
MEYIDKIFYRKINPSDFKKLYDIDRPNGGGGQTYLEASGISNEKIVDFLSYAEVSNSPLPKENRSIYTFNAYVLGNAKNESAFIEFAPRGGRNNYRISRQNMRYKHLAWSLENGFPEPKRDNSGEYTSNGNFEGIIDNLVIVIIRTTYRKYYASFINQQEMPKSWPVNIGLEEVFQGERRGVLALDLYKVKFINNRDNPFGNYEIIERIPGGTNTLLYGVPGSGKSWTIQHEYCNDENVMERLVFHPDYTYSDFVGQILPKVDDDGKVSYVFTPGPFTTLLREAYTHPNKEYFLVIEEINRGNAPAIFGEVFQLLDRKMAIQDKDDDGYPIGTSEYPITNADIAKVVYKDSNHKVRIPSNMSIIGTMNTSDQNVFTLDTAFQRRWNMRLIENSFENVNVEFANQKILDTAVTWKRFCTAINEIILDKNVRMTSSEDKRLGTYFVHLQDLIYDNDADNTNLDKFTRAKANRNNRRFPEKVIKYLWDDAFKFSREEIFEVGQYNSLEAIIRKFMQEKENSRFSIFKQNVFDAIVIDSNSQNQ